MTIFQRVVLANVVILVALTPARPVAAQEPPPQQQGQVNRPNAPGQRGRQQGLPPAAPGMTLQEMQSMFDAYALVQAQRMLQLNDEQYQRFFIRMNTLQDLRRRHNQQRMRMLNELRRFWRAEQSGEADLLSKIRAIDDLDFKFEGAIRTAHQAIDETLTVRQRAGFRFFEQDMERQKIDFLTRARAGRQGPG